MGNKITWIIAMLRYTLSGETRYIVRYCPGILVAGTIALGMAALFDAPTLFTGVVAMSLGAIGGALVDWRTERGLWMLAVVFLVLWGSAWLLFSYGRAMDILRGAQANPIGLEVDWAIGSVLLSSLMRFLVRVARENAALGAEHP